MAQTRAQTTAQKMAVGGLPRERRLIVPAAYAGAAALLLGAKLWLIQAYGNATPFWDQWAEALLYVSWLQGELGPGDLVAAHNEHRILTARLLALGLFLVNGGWNPLLQMVVNAVLHVAVVLLGVAVLARALDRRGLDPRALDQGAPGQTALPALLGFALVLFALPYAWANTLESFQSAFYLMLLFSVLGLWLLVPAAPLSGRWWGGVACGVLAFLSLVSGILALAAAAVVGAYHYGAGLRRDRRQLGAVAVLSGLLAAGVALTPSVATHEALRAGSPGQLLAALVVALSWPLPPGVPSALLRNLPLLLLVALLVRARAPAQDRRWLLAALGVWALGQAFALAYGRAETPLVSRYLDLHAMALMIGVACLLAVAAAPGLRRRWRVVMVLAWVVPVLAGLGTWVATEVPAQLAAKALTGRAQERNTRAYLRTGDLAHLEGQPPFHVPFPRPRELARWLDKPVLRGILPPAIKPPATPAAWAVTPPGSFRGDGLPAGAAAREGVVLGSYGARGHAARGTAVAEYPGRPLGGLLAVPVAGFPLEDGNRVAVLQAGEERPVGLDANPGADWRVGHAALAPGPFTLRVEDASAASWLAVGAPTVVGRFDPAVDALLRAWPLPLAGGAALLGLLGGWTALRGLRARRAPRPG